MELKESIKLRAEQIEQALCGYFAREDSDFSELLEAEKYSLFSGGKRIRPYLTLEFCKLFGGRAEDAMAYACAVEMIHTYSLIHDDLPCMDDDDMRRGKPSCHAKFGEATALLAGDALLTHAFGVCVSNPRLTPGQNARATALLAEAAGNFGMIGGQAIDLDENPENPSFERLLKLHSMKTGALIRAAILLGCIAAGVAEDDPRYADAERYAKGIGLTFQIVDDILDAREGESPEEKETFLTYMDEKSSYEYARRLTDDAIAAVSGYMDHEMLTDFAEYLYTRSI